LRSLVGAHADDVLTLLERFDANHPNSPRRAASRP
jgi:hypothetical protein